MADHRHIETEALIDLAQFETRMSPGGQLLHYARGRVRAFWLRQTLTVYGALVIGVLASMPLGAALAVLALAGEVADILCLRLVIRRVTAGGKGPPGLAIASAAVQACTIAACVALTWRMVAMHEARFFACAFLIAAMINAGLARPHMRAVADVRLAIFALTGFVLMALDLAQAEHARSLGYGFFAAAFALLAYISILFIETVERNYRKRRRNEYALLKNQHAQHLAQTELARTARDSQRLALVAKYATDSIIIAGPGGHIEWVNDAFSRITGYALDEVVGRLPGEFLNAEGTDADTIARLNWARESQQPVRAEVLNRTKSGAVFWMETSITPLFDDGGKLQLWISVERQITEAKEREAELARARAAAEEAGQAKSRFLANMSHEIRTPMNGVIGVAELLAETPLAGTQRDYVETILESGRLLLVIINDILDLAKLQSGKATLENRVFSLTGAVEGVLRILEPAAAKKAVGLRLNVPPNLSVQGDEGKLQQILLNLVGNAVKFTRSGTVTVTVRPPATSDDLVEIAVADTGIGIAPDRISSIFDSFSQADNGIARLYGGTGLGLTICAMLAEQMAGGITVESEVGCGSVFTLRVRMAVGLAASVAVRHLSAAPNLRPGLRVLVAEDNRTNMMIVRKMLQPHVACLIEAKDGAEALRLYCENPPDFALMDLSMPIKDGLQATREIRRFEAAHGLPRCPVVALTANAFAEDRAACRTAGLDGFLVKPLSRHDLMAEIGAYCPADPESRRAMGL